MKINDYFDWKDIKKADFANKLAIDPSYLSRLIHEKCPWSPRMAERVERITNGHVHKEELVWPDNNTNHVNK